MKTPKPKSSLMVLAGIVIGCGAAATAPNTFSTSDASASASRSTWACYNANDFDRHDYGRGKPAANKAERGMNIIAPDAHTGTIVTIPGNERDLSGVVCVKY